METNRYRRTVLNLASYIIVYYDFLLVGIKLQLVGAEYQMEVQLVFMFSCAY